MLKRIYNFLLFFCYPIIPFFWIFSKFYTVKFGNISPYRIGHLVGELSLWHLENLEKKKDYFEIWYVHKNACSKFFVKKIKHKIKISNSFLIKVLHDVFKKFNKNEYIIDPPKYGERDLNGLIYKNDKIINFSKKEIDLGNSLLEKIGISKNQEIVCICIRDNHFFKNSVPDFAWERYEFKNSNIENYNKAINYLNTKNIAVVRMGAGSEKSWSMTGNINIDYSLSKLRQSFLDFFLIYRAKFVVMNGTGFYWVPYVLKKPIVMADFIPIGSICSYIPNSIHIFKHIYSNQKKRNLMLDELFSDEFNFVYGSDKYKQRNLEIVDNSPDEIFECVKEMNKKIDGEWENTGEHQTNQKLFWDNYPKFIKNYKGGLQRHKEINASIGNIFLKKYISNFKGANI